jgi:hypothetical protein
MRGRELSHEYARRAFRSLANLYPQGALLARAALLEKLIRASALKLGVSTCADGFIDDLRRATAQCYRASDDFDSLQGALDTLPDVPPEIAENPEMAGWCYQIWNEPDRNANSWAISRRAEEQHESADAGVLTQLFTDEYLADFLVDRCLTLCEAQEKIRVSGLTVCDPACGVGHILMAAVRRLSRSGSCPQSIGKMLVGFEIDPVAVAVARALVFIQVIACGYIGDRDKLINDLRSSIINLPEPFGTLDRAALVAHPRVSFDVVVTNPPYLGRRKLSSEMKTFLDQEYPATRVDLCAAFMQRCIELCSQRGVVGLLTSDKWLRLRGYESVRKGRDGFKGVLGELSLDLVLELGAKAFHPSAALHDGVKAAIVCGRKQSPQPDHTFEYSNLTVRESYTEKVQAIRKMTSLTGESTEIKRLAQRDWLEQGTSSLLLGASDLPKSLLQTPVRVAHGADVVVGIQTSDDARYVRYVWEVPAHQSGWRIHSKGGGYARWYGLNRWVINWDAWAGSFFKTERTRQMAEQWVGRGGWTYTWFANGALGLRTKEAGWSFGRAAASGFFCEDPRLVAYLNSRFASVSTRAIGGKVQLPEGVVRELPVPQVLDDISLELVALATEVKMEITKGDLADALYDPSLKRDLVQELGLEALLLVIEGMLEWQVECALGISRDESESWRSTHGAPVAWLPTTFDIATHPTWNTIPGNFSNYQAALMSYLESMPAQYKGEVGHQMQAGVVLREVPSYPYRFALPTTGPVEHLSRAYQAHPFDVVGALVEGLQHDSPVVRSIRMSRLCSEVTREILQGLGHTWWSAVTTPVPVEFRSFTQKDLCSLVERCAELQASTGLLSSSVKTWIRRQLIPWQRKRFMGAPPLSLTESKSGEILCARRLAA